MIQLALLSCFFLFAAAFLLWDRVTKGAAQVRESEFASALERRVDRDLLRDWRGVPVRHREATDPYRTVGELLDELARMSCTTLVEHQRRIKALYQLQDALDLPETPLAAALVELRDARFMSRPIGSVETIRPGQLVDRRSMWPLTRGARVRQPLGVIVRDADGRVVSKAKVVCG